MDSNIEFNIFIYFMVYIIIYTIICHINYIKGMKHVYRSNNIFTNHTNDTNRIINLLNEQMIINRYKQMR